MTWLQKAVARSPVDPRALVGVLVLAIGTLVWLLAFTNQLASLFGGSTTTTVRAEFQSIEDIVPNDPVRIDGVQVGTVSGVTPSPGGRGATVTMSLDTTAGKIYRDASASIQWRTVLGANDAVALDPGTRAAGLLGDQTIPQSHDSNQVELDQITQAVHGPAQQGMRTMLQQLAPALQAHAALARDFTTLAEIAPEAAVGIGALRGEVPDTDLKNLVRQTSRAADALDVGTGGAETRRFVQSAAQTLNAVAANPTDLRNAIVETRAVLPVAKESMSGLNRTLDLLDPLMAMLIPEVPQIAPTLETVRPALEHTHALLTAATPLLDRLRPAVDALTHAARTGVPVINSLSPSLQRLSNQILPGLREKGPEEGGHPAYQMIGPTLVGIGALSGFFNQDGEFANLTLGLEEPQSAQILPCTEDFSGRDFLVCSTLSQALATFMSGGTSVLQSLSRRPGGANIFGPLIPKAAHILSQFDATRNQLLAKVPALAKWLLSPNHGSRR